MQWWHLEAGLEPEFLNDACILQHTKTQVSVAVRPISFCLGLSRPPPTSATHACNLHQVESSPCVLPACLPVLIWLQ